MIVPLKCDNKIVKFQHVKPRDALRLARNNNEPVVIKLDVVGLQNDIP